MVWSDIFRKYANQKMIEKLLSPCGKLLYLARRVKRRLLMYFYMPLFADHGKNFLFDPEGFYSYRRITVGNDVNLGVRPILSASGSHIHIGNKVMFGPEVTIMGGNHTISLIGRYMMDVKAREKSPNDDLGVVIEDDVWIGTHAIILNGVSIGRGSVIGAGSVVTRNVPPYAIVAGSPAKVLRYRWDIETIMQHESQLYPVALRLTRAELEKWREEK